MCVCVKKNKNKISYFKLRLILTNVILVKGLSVVKMETTPRVVTVVVERDLVNEPLGYRFINIFPMSTKEKGKGVSSRLLISHVINI